MDEHDDVHELLKLKKICQGLCQCPRLKKDYSAAEWANKEDAHCKVCVATRKRTGTPYLCILCRKWCAAEQFAFSTPLHGTQRQKCKTCLNVQTSTCVSCGKEKSRSEFASSHWKQRKSARKCIVYMSGRKCSNFAVCGTQGNQRFFSAEEWKKTDVAI